MCNLCSKDSDVRRKELYNLEYLSDQLLIAKTIVDNLRHGELLPHSEDRRWDKLESASKYIIKELIDYA